LRRFNENGELTDVTPAMNPRISYSAGYSDYMIVKGQSVFTISILYISQYRWNGNVYRYDSDTSKSHGASGGGLICMDTYLFALKNEAGASKLLFYSLEGQNPQDSQEVMAVSNIYNNGDSVLAVVESIAGTARYKVWVEDGVPVIELLGGGSGSGEEIIILQAMK